jgi:putative PIN family toxin of toxin-antitoxin system
LINPHGLWGRIVFTRTGRYRLVPSEPTIREIVEVLARPELVRKFRAMAGLDGHAVLAILAVAEVVEVGEVVSVARDKKDDPYLATARAARADYLVTEDEDLLVLGEYEGTKIVNAATFLAILDAMDEDDG